HSLRAGFVTSAVKRGANLIKITDVTGHRSLEMLKTYSRDAEAFVGHAGAGPLGIRFLGGNSRRGRGAALLATGQPALTAPRLDSFLGASAPRPAVSRFSAVWAAMPPYEAL